MNHCWPRQREGKHLLAKCMPTTQRTSLQTDWASKNSQEEILWTVFDYVTPKISQSIKSM